MLRHLMFARLVVAWDPMVAAPHRRPGVLILGAGTRNLGYSCRWQAGRLPGGQTDCGARWDRSTWAAGGWRTWMEFLLGPMDDEQQLKLAAASFFLCSGALLEGSSCTLWRRRGPQADLPQDGVLWLNCGAMHELAPGTYAHAAREA